jgi:SAM-dependent methyltransferase
VRPADPSVLEGRPLLDLGTGDGQTLAALSDEATHVVGLDRSLDALRAARQTGLQNLVCGDAAALPFGAGSLATVLAGDVFHHLDEDTLGTTLKEISGVLRGGGRLVAWWYGEPGRQGTGAPRYPRRLSEVEGIALRCGFASVSPLALTATLYSTPQTVGLTGTAR